LKRDITDWSPKNRPKIKEYLVETSNSIPNHIKWLNDVINNDERDGFTFRKNYLIIKPTDLYGAYESWLINNYIINSGEFKSPSFRKIIQKMNGVKWNHRIKINGKNLERVVIDVNIITNELEKYNFDGYDSDDSVLDLDDDSDIEEDIP